MSEYKSALLELLKYDGDFFILKCCPKCFFNEADGCANFKEADENTKPGVFMNKALPVALGYDFSGYSDNKKYNRKCVVISFKCAHCNYVDQISFWIEQPTNNDNPPESSQDKLMDAAVVRAYRMEKVQNILEDDRLKDILVEKWPELYCTLYGHMHSGCYSPRDVYAACERCDVLLQEEDLI